MKKIWRDRWLEWLETPNRPQAMAAFYDPEFDCYCATGGLCRLLVDAGAADFEFSHGGGMVDPDGVLLLTEKVATEVAAVTGLTRLQFGLVIGRNDVYGDTLPEIARWIRRNVPEEV